MKETRTVYFDHGRAPAEQRVFPCGEAGPVHLGADGEWSTETVVAIGPNSHCALLNHGVAAEIESHPAVEGSVGSGLDALVPPAAAEDLARIFYEADRKTYGARYDFVAFEQEIPEPVVYRIAIDNREYQKTLSQLQFLATTAARHGHGVRIRI